MEKVLLLADSASDITKEMERESGVRILNIHINMGGQDYEDREQLDIDRFLQEMGNMDPLPTSSQVTAVEFYTAFCQAVEEGYNRLICCTLNAQGSGTYEAALTARQLFLDEHPQLQAQVRIDCVDGMTYSMGYGWHVLKAADMLRAGASGDEILAYLQHAYRAQASYVGVYSLQFPKKSGRLTASATFVGEVLGVKPILEIDQGRDCVCAKVRGDKHVVEKLAQLFGERAEDPKGDYIMIYGIDRTVADELEALIARQYGARPYRVCKIGPAIALNSGPKMVGIAFLQKR